MDFAQLMQWLDGYRVADVLLPFMLIFLIVFATLEKTKILGEGKKQFNVMMSLIMGLAVIFPHVLGVEPDIVPIINSALPQVSIIAVAIIMFLFIVGVWGAKVNIAGKSIGGWITLLSFLLIVWIFGASAGWGWSIPVAFSWLLESDVVALLFIILIFGLVISYITKEEKTGDKTGFIKKFNDSLKELTKD